MAIVSAVKIIGKKQPKKKKKNMNLSVRLKKKNVDAPILYLPLYMLKKNFF